MMSPCFTPAAAAPVFAITLMTTAPFDTVKPYSCCNDGDIDSNFYTDKGTVRYDAFAGDQ